MHSNNQDGFNQTSKKLFCELSHYLSCFLLVFEQDDVESGSV